MPEKKRAAWQGGSRNNEDRGKNFSTAGKNACPLLVRWLHVEADGSEVWFDDEPEDLPTLRVERKRKREVVRTDILWDRYLHTSYFVHPRGKGWKFSGVEMPFVVWHRAVQP